MYDMFVEALCVMKLGCGVMVLLENTKHIVIFLISTRIKMSRLLMIYYNGLLLLSCVVCKSLVTPLHKYNICFYTLST